MNIRRILTSLAVALLGLALATSAAFAVGAISTVSLNVRSGPGPGYGVVDVLRKGEAVNVTQCTSTGSWCYITHSGPDGWVYARYLARTDDRPAPTIQGTPPVHFGIFIGPEGPSFSFGYGTPAPVKNPRACFYNFSGYTGGSICVDAGTRYNRLGSWNDRISSIRVFDGATVKVCRNTFMGGYCRTISSNTRVLGPFLNNEISSLRVY